MKAKKTEELLKIIEEKNMIIQKMKEETEALKTANFNLCINMTLLQRYAFGVKREKLEEIVDEEIKVVDEEENKTEEQEKTEMIEETEKSITKQSISNAEKKKVKKNKTATTGINKAYASEIDREIIEYEKNTDEVCDICGSQYKKISKKLIREELVFVSPSFKIVRHYTTVYKCSACGTENSNRENCHLVKAKVPKPVLTHSRASSSLLANIMYTKFSLGVPLYRQEKLWDNKGLILPRNVSSNWIIKSCEYYLHSLVELMLKRIKENAEVIHMDETTMQCNKEEGRKPSSKSYMWVLATGKDESTKAVIFSYNQSRSSEVAKALIKNYNKNLVTDGYTVYKTIEDIIHSECWSHLRRYFFDSIPLIKNKLDVNSPGYKGVDYCDQIFEIEAELAPLSNEERQVKRILKIKPIIDEFYNWIREMNSDKKALLNSKFDKAIKYALNQEKGLTQFLNDGKIPLTNNLVERTIRPFAVHRKNWLFADSVDGANASATMYSLMETSKLNDLDFEKYLKFLFDELPQLDCINEETLEDYLPWSSKLPKEVRNVSDIDIIDTDIQESKLFVTKK